jgi:intracellular septation protein
MHFLADYFPLILFFVAFKVSGIYVATGVAIAASVIQIAYFRWRRGRVATIHWLSLAIIVVFGGATLLLHDETFIKWKPTVLYWLFAARVAFLVGMGAVNLYVAANFTTDTWVNFKVWGGIGLFMLAAVGTVASVARYLPEQS